MHSTSSSSDWNQLPSELWVHIGCLGGPHVIGRINELSRHCHESIASNRNLLVKSCCPTKAKPNWVSWEEWTDQVPKHTPLNFESFNNVAGHLEVLKIEQGTVVGRVCDSCARLTYHLGGIGLGGVMGLLMVPKTLAHLYFSYFVGSLADSDLFLQPARVLFPLIIIAAPFLAYRLIDGRKERRVEDSVAQTRKGIETLLASDRMALGYLAQRARLVNGKKDPRFDYTLACRGKFLITSQLKRAKHSDLLLYDSCVKVWDKRIQTYQSRCEDWVENLAETEVNKQTAWNEIDRCRSGKSYVVFSIFRSAVRRSPVKQTCEVSSSI